MFSDLEERYSVLSPILPNKGWTVGGQHVELSWHRHQDKEEVQMNWEVGEQHASLWISPLFCCYMCPESHTEQLFHPATVHPPPHPPPTHTLTLTCSLNMCTIARVDDSIFSLCKGVLLTLPGSAQAIKSNRADLVSVQSVLRNKKHDPDSMLYFTLSSNSVEID